MTPGTAATDNPRNERPGFLCRLMIGCDDRWVGERLICFRCGKEHLSGQSDWWS